MSISFGLSANLSTSQKLTPQMQQAIKLLQLSSLELAQEVQMKLDNNPLLERIEEDDLESLEDIPEHLQDLSQNFEIANDRLPEDYRSLTKNSSANTMDSGDAEDTFQDSSDRLQDNAIGELSVDSHWDDVYTHAPTSLANSNVQDYDDYRGATASNLQDHIRWQMNLKHLNETDLLIANYLIDAMEETGIISIDLVELEQILSTMASFYQWELSIEYDQILMVLHIIQSCEPLGVGACSLAECLQIQLRRLDELTPYRNEAITLLDAHEHLINNNINQLIEQTGIIREDIAPTLALIRTLNPAPGLAYITDQPNSTIEPESYDIPDVIVTAIYQMADGDTKETLNIQGMGNKSEAEQVSWQVKLNPETLPKLRVNKQYANLVKRGDNSPDNVYLKDNLMDARLFIRSIEERNQNLLKVATCIVERQQAFLLEGATAMQPMVLKDVAEVVDLHESTVSRLTTSKSMLTPQGLFSLKHFFSSHVASSEGNVSSTAISAMIKTLITNEDLKKPLSDSAIQKLLDAEGIDIARRTVAKYREAMNIGSSTQRKQKF